MENGNSKVKCDNEVIFTQSSYADMPSSNILIAGTPQSGYVGSSMYGAKFYRNNTLIRDFVPCYNKTTNTIRGLYDLVEDKLYTNAGTGSFAVGPDV